MMSKNYRGDQTTTDELEVEVNKLKEGRLQVSEAKNEAEGDDELEKALLAEGDKSLSDDEQIWRKRYADGRRHQQSTQDKFKEAEATLTARIKELEAATTTLPTNTEDLKAWQEKHPEVHDIVVSLATQQADKSAEAATKELREEISKLKEDNTKLTTRDSVTKVKEAHPDYSTLEKSVKFHDWVEQKGGWVHTAIYASTDAQPAIDAINLYKAENGLFQVEKEDKKRGPGRPRKTDEEKDAAKSVSKSTTGDPDSTSSEKKIWKESEVEALSGKAFEEKYMEIKEAQADGRFLVGQ